MNNLVSDLVASYEHRIAMVESLVNTACDTTAESEETFEHFHQTQNEGEELVTQLREILAQNRSLRRKDFDSMVVRTIGTVQESRRAIEDERKQIRLRLTAHLRNQKSLMSRLGEQLSNYGPDDYNSDKLQTSIDELKKNYNDEGRQIFADLRDFQAKVAVFCREQQLLNDKVRHLLERSEHLRLEDLRQLKAIGVRKSRQQEREVRRQDVERLLTKFRNERKEARPSASG